MNKLLDFETITQKWWGGGEEGKGEEGEEQLGESYEVCGLVFVCKG